jgi:hypothetical protein
MHLREGRTSTNQIRLAEMPTDVRLAKWERMTTRANPVSGLVAEMCGVGEPLPKSDFVVAKQANAYN